MARYNPPSYNDNGNIVQSHSCTPKSTITNISQRRNALRQKNKARVSMTESHVNNVVKFDRHQSKVNLIPRNAAQEEYVDYLMDDKCRIVIAVGPAGTGKTLLGVLRAIRALRQGEVTKILITRPAVSVDEQHGFLPGDLNAKMEPWTKPIFDVFEEYYPLPEVKRLVENGIIEVCPLAYMRGRTFKNAYIIADEMQNATCEQMKMLLTRIGDNARMIVTGDLKQHDRGYEKNGLKDFIDKLEEKHLTDIALATFERKHVERDPIVSKVLSIYGEE
jgi:phosphate starvation-inducible protein PhoH and related proteins